MMWKELRFQLRGLDAALTEAALEELGALAVTLEDAADEALLEPAPGEQPLWTQTRVRALFDAATDAAALADELWRRLGVAAPPEWQVATVEDRQWETVWRDGFGPMRFGDRLWVCPTDAPAPKPGAIVVWLDPGLAFGTGTHPTTALCLEWLARADVGGKTVVDYGCGSGILSIAAAKLGAARVYAVDHDAQALAATGDNAAANGVAEKVVAVPPEALAAREADLLVANILARPLLTLANDFAELVRAGGGLALSGILDSQCEALRAAYAPGFVMEDPISRREWVLLEGRRKG